MKQLYFLSILIWLFIGRIDPALAATVGNPLDLDVPRRSAILRQEVIEETLDRYEEMFKIKAAVDLEFTFDKDLHTPWEVSNAEIEGQWYMAKLGVTVFGRVEPYVKIGTTNLTVNWRQNNSVDIEVDGDGFAWGGGVKGIIWEFEDWGVRLTGDLQYRTTAPDVGEVTKGGASVSSSGADFELKEWQASLVLSKKFELPLRWQSIYIVPYTGLTLSDSNVDVKFTAPGDPTDYSLFEANNRKIYGFLIGCDIMPTLTSSFIYSIEARFINEFSLTLGGAMKF